MNILSKIKEKGISGCAHSVKCRIIRLHNNILFKKYEKMPIDECSIVLESEGDCCDNAYALFDYMEQNGYVGKYRITWLVDHPENYHDEGNVQYVRKNLYEHFTKKTIKALRTCKWYIYDHSNLMAEHEKRVGQSLIYLSHGWGYKAPKGMKLSVCKSKYDYMTSTGPLAAKGLSEYWDTPLKSAIITGYPRLDYLFEENKIVKKLIENKWKFSDYNKVLYWMPTFRQSVSKDLNEDYIQNETGLPLFNSIESLKEFDEFLLDLNAFIVLKLHHLQADLPVFSLKFHNIVVVRDEELRENGIQLYQFLKYADAMISDYSSISIDFMVTNKPIIYILDDYDEYDKSRGLFPENAINYMPGYHVYSPKEMKNCIGEIVQGIDKYSKERKDIVSQYHTYQDGNSSKRVLDQFGIVK